MSDKPEFKVPDLITRPDLQEQIATLRRELDEARADLDVAESRKAQAFRDLKSRAEAAESALSEARAEVERQAEGLRRLRGQVDESVAALSEARKESAGLREALRAVLSAVRQDEKHQYYDARAWLDKRDVYNGDLSGAFETGCAVLEAVVRTALGDER